MQKFQHTVHTLMKFSGVPHFSFSKVGRRYAAAASSIALKRKLTLFNNVIVIFCQWQISSYYQWYISHSTNHLGGMQGKSTFSHLIAVGHILQTGLNGGSNKHNAEMQKKRVQLDIISIHYITTFPVGIIFKGLINWGHYWLPRCFCHCILENFLHPHLFKFIGHILYWVCFA